MARIRTIKPEFWTSEQVVECSPIARLLFIGMWNFCDDAGNHPASAKTIKMQVFPGDDIAISEIQAMVDQLVSNGLLKKYSADDKDYLHVTGWHHQKIEKPNFKHPKHDFDDQSSTSRRPVDPVMEGKGREVITPPNPPAGGEEVGKAPGEAQAPTEAELENQLLENWCKPDNSRVQYQMPVNWTCQTYEIEKYLLLMHAKALVNGKRVTASQITPEIMADFIRSNHAEGRRLRHDQWINKLAGYLVARIQAGFNRDGGQLLPENNPNFDYPLHVSKPRSASALPVEEQRARIRLIQGLLGDDEGVAA